MRVLDRGTLVFVFGNDLNGASEEIYDFSVGSAMVLFWPS
jgi:hypothetical protein